MKIITFLIWSIASMIAAIPVCPLFMAFTPLGPGLGFLVGVVVAGFIGVPFSKWIIRDLSS
jgi:hypothetical protein